MTTTVSNLISDLVIIIVLLLIFGVAYYVGLQITKLIKSKSQYVTLQKILELAKSAVVQAEKEGLINKQTGEQQFDNALNKVTEELKTLGIQNIDLSIIKGAIERAYAMEKSYLDHYYTDK